MPPQGHHARRPPTTVPLDIPSYTLPWSEFIMNCQTKLWIYKKIIQWPIFHKISYFIALTVMRNEVRRYMTWSQLGFMCYECQFSKNHLQKTFGNIFPHIYSKRVVLLSLWWSIDSMHKYTNIDRNFTSMGWSFTLAQFICEVVCTYPRPSKFARWPAGWPLCEKRFCLKPVPLIARFMGPKRGPAGATGLIWAPFWPQLHIFWNWKKKQLSMRFVAWWWDVYCL